MDERNSMKIGCTTTGETSLSSWLDIELESNTCYRGVTSVQYRVYYEITEIE